MKEDELLFVLDIGTRSVTGVAGRVRGDMLEVLRVESVEHSERAVVDGQIENIAQTAKVAGLVKSRLEDALGRTLKEVHVAAAGRVLKTERASCELELDDREPVGARNVLALESKAVQQAYERLAEEAEDGEPASFCCVGHTAVGYTLDGYSFSTLTGHRGRLAGVELIATFLPNEVVESLYTTMSMVGLSIASMTLEPIAAMNAVVPQELRLLNVALVDVGAGTSDIAVANNGGVCGYTMATIAGDEITERVMRELLVDFGTAERIKFEAAAGAETIEYSDVLGIPCTVSNGELLEHIRPAVEELARRIAEGVAQVNGGSPMAVFMVGGGSRTPGLCRMVAQALSIDEKRVAIGGSNYMKRLVSADMQYLSAEYATPIGIAVTAMTAGGGEGFAVTLNGARIQMFGGGTMNVMEALLRGGYQYGQIMGRSGKSVIFTFNGERRIARGGLPTLAEVQVNGALAGLSAPLQAGDEIRFTPAESGTDAAPRLSELVERWNPVEVTLFDEPRMAGTLAWVNGEPAGADRAVLQADEVRVRQVLTVGELLEEAGLPVDASSLAVNGEPCGGAGQTLLPGDRIGPLAQATEAPAAPKPVPPHAPPVPAAPEYAPAARRLRVSINGRDRLLDPKPDGVPYQFFDLLNFVDIDPAHPQGDIVLLRNGAPASYLEPIQQDDRIEIFWA